MNKELLLLPFFNFLTKIKSISFIEYSSKKLTLQKEFIEIIDKLNQDNFDFNSFIFKEDNTPEEYTPFFKNDVTLTYFIIELGWSNFLTLFLEKYGNKLSQNISNEENTNLLLTLYYAIEENGTSLDSIIPLIFLFKDIEFIYKINSINRKLLLVDYLIDKSREYIKNNDTFLEKLKIEQGIIYKMKSQSIISNLNTALSIAETETNKLWRGENSKLKNILLEVNSLRNKIKEAYG